MTGFLKTYGTPLISGILPFLAFPASNLHYLAWIALVPLWVHVRHKTAAQTALHLFIAGGIFHYLTLQWLTANIYWAGGWALWSHALLCIALASFWAILGLLWKWSSDRNPRLGAIAPFVFLWGSMEFVQSFILTGFGWSALAHSQSYNLYAFQWGALGGFTLIGMLIVLVNALLGEAITNPAKRLQLLGTALAVVAIVHGAGFLMLRPATYGESPLQVGIFQSNTPLQTKWDPEYREHLLNQAVLKSRVLAEHERVDLFVWPEALVSTNIDTNATQSALASLIKDTRADLFTGAHRSDGFGVYNSSYFIGPEFDFSNYYDKMHLAPYGEYVPLAEYLPFLGRIVPSVTDQTPGTERKTFESHGRTLGPLICFEVLFSPMSQDLLKDGADFLTVITNLGWFGSSNAIPQELAIAKLRAIETRLPLVQASNTGISGIIDPFGRLTGLDRAIDKNGTVFTIREELTPEQTINMRLVGALPLPNAAKQPIPYGPRYWPYIVSGLTILLLLASAIKPKPTDAGPKKS
ncbi:MAG: apolipoprotein N-acyltransferase [Candidatus Hydrogenedentota bacterium]